MSTDPAAFARRCAALGLADGAPLGIAVSGGADSLALLLIAHGALPGRIAAATVDHGLRAEAAGEAQMVAEVCADLGVPHDSLAVTVDRGGGVQAAARKARYAALGEWAQGRSIRCVAVAHHADDVAETLLMRLNRGAGLRGLAAMRERRPMPGFAEVSLLRPLLRCHRADLSGIVAKAGLTPVDDPTNDDPRYDRTHARGLLTSGEWLDPARLAAAAFNLRDAEDVLEAAALAERDGVERLPDDGGAWYAPQGGRALRLRTIEWILAEMGSEGEPRGQELARLLETLEGGGKATLAGVVCDGRARRWFFAPAPARRT